MTSGSDNPGVVRRLIVEVWGRGDLSLLSQLVSEDVTVHAPGAGAALRGLAAYREFIAAYQSLFGEMSFSIEDQLEDGSKVATRWTVRLKPVTASAGQPDEQVVMGMSISNLSEGKIVECWDTWDSLSVFEASQGADVLERLSISL